MAEECPMNDQTEIYTEDIHILVIIYTSYDLYFNPFGQEQ